MSVLVLGTAQWGLAYGATNLGGRPSDESVQEQVKVAKDAGISRLDTASRYGDSQRRIRPWAHEFLITTKVAGGSETGIRSEFEYSINEMGLDRVDSLLIHDWEELGLETKQSSARVLNDLKSEGLASRVGVSVYSEAGLQDGERLFELLDLAQVPSNVLDRRLVDSETVMRLKETGTNFQIRSIFLQGLLINPAPTLHREHPDLLKYYDYAQGSEIQVALAHAKSISWGSELLVGVSSAKELIELCAIWKATHPKTAPPQVSSEDCNLIDPRNWSQ